MLPSLLLHLSAFQRIDFCSLANNHVLDFKLHGMRETLSSLRAAGIRCSGAGENRAQAAEPAVLDVPVSTHCLLWGTALKFEVVDGLGYMDCFHGYFENRSLWAATVDSSVSLSVDQSVRLSS